MTRSERRRCSWGTHWVAPRSSRRPGRCHPYAPWPPWARRAARTTSSTCSARARGRRGRPGAGRHRRAAVRRRPRVPRGHRPPAAARAPLLAGAGAARPALADRRDRRHRQRPDHLRRRPPPEVVRGARWCRPPAVAPGGLGVRRGRHRRLGTAPPPGAGARDPRGGPAAGIRAAPGGRRHRGRATGLCADRDRRRAQLDAGRAGERGRGGHRPQPLRHPVVRAGRLHVHHPAHVRHPQGLGRRRGSRSACGTTGSTRGTARSARDRRDARPRAAPHQFDPALEPASGRRSSRSRTSALSTAP